MTQSTVAAPALSPLNGKPILLNFDGAEMSSDAGLTLLREVERRHDLAGLVASYRLELEGACLRKTIAKMDDEMPQT